MDVCQKYWIIAITTEKFERNQWLFAKIITRGAENTREGSFFDYIIVYGVIWKNILKVNKVGYSV